VMNGMSPEHDSQVELARAEEMVDSIGQAIGGFATRVGLEIMKGVALAREEAEDIWAEAESIAHSRPQ